MGAMQDYIFCSALLRKAIQQGLYPYSRHSLYPMRHLCRTASSAISRTTSSENTPKIIPNWWGNHCFSKPPVLGVNTFGHGGSLYYHSVRYCSGHQAQVVGDNQPPVTQKLTRSGLLTQLLEELVFSTDDPDWIQFRDKFMSVLPNSKQWPSVAMKMLSAKKYNTEDLLVRITYLGDSLLEFTRHLDKTNEITEHRRSHVTISLLTSYMKIHGQYLLLLSRDNKEEEEVLTTIYNEIREKAQVFDFDNSLAIIDALTSSRNLWRQGLDLYNEVRDLYPLTEGHLVPLITAAIHDDYVEVANELLEELAGILQGKAFIRVLDARVVGAFTDKARRDRDVEPINILLRQMRRHGWLLPEATVDPFISYYESLPGSGWTGRRTSITPGGVCRSCKQRLQTEELTLPQFETLRDTFLQTCVRREDVFLNTSPQELEKFQNFLASQQKFDFVLDGLNIGLMLSGKKRHLSGLKLQTVVEDLATKGRVLVLGRKHMEGWSQKHIARIKKIATVFFAENITKDDPFILYAALDSGPQTCLVTRDMLRDHRYLLPVELRDDFNVWQRTHQITFSLQTPQPVYTWPSSLDTRVQWTDATYHVPVEDQSERASHELPNSWVCLQKNHV